ncbi:MAG: ABC transporter ATP-binding protein [Halobacteriovoraceae bacterium]|jgi:ABC-2 type transport system ATP-binding protein|nr:ABC transporter ATP-binding protein [Halobacteriovoraceae bacterium]
MSKAIEVDCVSMTYSRELVLKNISFCVNKGTIHGFLGPNGAGKTTTMKLLTKVLHHQTGKIKILNQDLSRPDQFFYKKIGFLLEDPPLYPDLTVTEYLHFMAKIKRIEKGKIQKHISYCLDVLDLINVKDRLIENLSKGYKQRVGIAQAIIHMPEIVILDEPTNGLDPQSVIEIRNLILNLKKEHTVLLSSHMLHEMSLVCDDITIISEGRVLESGSLESLQEKINNTQEVIVELADHNPQFEQYLSKHQTIRHYESMQQDEIFRYIITPNERVELRPQMAKMAIELGASLLRIDRKEYSLEDLFVSVTGQHD